jgi:hypothetical protein
MPRNEKGTLTLLLKVIHWISRSKIVFVLEPVHSSRLTGGFGGDSERWTESAVVRRAIDLSTRPPSSIVDKELI